MTKIFAALIPLVFVLQACAEENSAPNVITETNVAIPMRDGTLLMADIYRPNTHEPVPVLVYRTPYGKHRAPESYATHLSAVQRGYAVVMQDVRGRYASEGIFTPYSNEGRDGYDTIEWAADQPWSNGKIGTFGLSYPGAVQWLAAIESPPHLEAMVPAMTFSSPRNFFYMNGIFDLSWLPWIHNNIAPDARVRLDLPGIRTGAEARMAWASVSETYRSFLPLSELPYLRDEAPYYFEWLTHPPEDDWWDWSEIRGKYDKTGAAVLNLSGWYDDAYGPEGAITNFNGLRAARANQTNQRSHLVMGPWVHGVNSTKTGQVRELDFGPQAAIDYDALLLDFFDHYLKGLDNDFARQPIVRQFVMGENQWRTHNEWPIQDAETQDLYLGVTEHSTTTLSLTSPGGKEQSSFISDPANPVTDPYNTSGPHDYQALQRRSDVLVFESAPLTKDLVVSGLAKAILYVSCNCRDMDLWIKLIDVHPDGSAYNLMSPGGDAIRASYRKGYGERQLLEPQKVYTITLPNLITSNRFAPGHKIRVQISGTFAHHLSRNLQTGESEIYSSQSEVATITIHHSEEFPSKLVLPILDPVERP